MPHDTPLPSHRRLAKDLRIGINTVVKAYEQLVHEGYVTNIPRKGLYVSKIDFDPGITVQTKKHPARKTLLSKPKAEFTLLDQTVDERNFPVKQWRKCANWALDGLKFQYEVNDVNDQLKEQLVGYLFQARGVKSTPERIVIGSGTNAMLLWLAFILRHSHKKITFEEPCYQRPREIFQGMEYQLSSVRVTPQGIDVNLLDKVKADLLYLTPSHQYPTGAAMPVSNRLKILRWARKNNAFIIEDDFDSEFRYRTKLMPSLQGLDDSNCVIYMGTFSNAVMPSMRVAYVVLPANFPFEEHRDLTFTVPYTIRKTLALFIEHGFWQQHLRKMRKLYHAKYERCIAALSKIPDELITFNDTPSGLNILLHFNTHLTEAGLVARALKSGIVIRPTSSFYLGRKNIPRKPEMLFEFGNLPLAAIEIVVEKLAACSR